MAYSSFSSSFSLPSTAQLGNPYPTHSLSCHPDELPVCRHRIAPILQIRVLESGEAESRGRISFALRPVLFLMTLCGFFPKCWSWWVTETGHLFLL